MKVWTKVQIHQKNKKIEEIVTAYINYLFKDTTLAVLAKKYKIDSNDMMQVYQELASRISGLLILYLGNDKKRLHDILKRYHGENAYLNQIIPEVEGYVDRS